MSQAVMRKVSSVHLEEQNIYSPISNMNPFSLSIHSCHMEELWVYSMLKIRPSSFSPWDWYYIYIHVQNQTQLTLMIWEIHTQRMKELLYVTYFNKYCNGKIKRKPLEGYSQLLLTFFLFVHTLTHILSIKKVLNNCTSVKIWRSNS